MVMRPGMNFGGLYVSGFEQSRHSWPSRFNNLGATRDFHQGLLAADGVESGEEPWIRYVDRLGSGDDARFRGTERCDRKGHHHSVVACCVNRSTC
jgi:hypothetical protein